MQLIDVKSNKSLSQCHDSPKRTLPCAICILFISFLNDSGGGAFASSQCPHPGEFANFILKNAYAQGLAQEGGWAQVELTDALHNAIINSL